MTELGLFACAAATCFGLVRIFGDFGFAGRTLLIAALALATASILRRRGVGAGVALVAHAIIGLLVLTNTYLGSTTWFGLPTTDSFDAARSVIPDSLTQLRSAVPPVNATTGLLLVIGAAIWALCLFADTAAFRVHARVQAVLPFCAAFLALGVPDSDVAEVQSVAVFAAGLGLYALAAQHDRDRSMRWAADTSGARRSSAVAGAAEPAHSNATRGAWRLSASASAIAISAIAVAVLISAFVPTPAPLVNLRQSNHSKGREVTTPFVSIRNLLGARSNADLFTVTTSSPNYWRITALDTYDPGRDIWVSSGTYSPARGELEASTDSTVTTQRLRQRFEIQGLNGPWIPAMFEAARIEGIRGVTYSPDSSTLFAEDDLKQGQEFTIESNTPEFSTEQLAGFPNNPGTLTGKYGATAPISGAERAVLQRLVLSAPDAYSGLIGLQNWFRESFVYDESVDYSGAGDPIRAFLIEGRGFCQQFASTFAIMARRIGMASRVAVGFTMGQEVSERSANSDEHTYQVKGLHAHAWPEVYFPGVGWVGFEPTPGRGNPATEAITGAAGSQATAPEAESTTTTSPTTTSTPTPSTTPGGVTVPTTTPGSTADEPVDDGSTSRQTGDLVRWTLVGLVVVAALGGLLWRSRRRRPKHAEFRSPADEQIWLAWHSAVRAVSQLGSIPTPNETPIEFADRTNRQVQA
ncbi:MAG: transglutaminase domain-containing protein, partial [Microthrixaceae bacterium]|nr:transglutaminase domain-containing protein [Microthrixaceae bacterium]